MYAIRSYYESSQPRLFLKKSVWTCVHTLFLFMTPRMPSRITMHRPRIIIAGLNGGTGKTITSLGTTRAWVRTA